MARPHKQGLDYFPFDVDFFSDEKIAAISGAFGIKGEITAIKLLCAVYRNGYYAEWNEMLQMKLLKELPGVSVELLRQIVGRLVKWEFFDESLFNTSGILTSRGIQKRFFSIAYRRNFGNRNLPYVINDSRNGVIDSKNTPANGLLLAKTPQSKGKVKEIKTSTDVDAKSPASPSKLTLIPFEKNVEECLQSQEWQEMTLMSLHLTKIDWKEAFKAFRASLVANGSDTDKTRKDFRQHFVSWYRIQKQNENGKHQENMARNDRTRGGAGFGRPEIAPATVVSAYRGKSCI